DELAAEARGNKIDPLGRTAHEDNFPGRPRTDKALQLLARALVGVGRTRRQPMRTAMNIRVLVLVIVDQPLDYRIGFLRRRRIVEPHQTFAVNPLLEDREIARISL